MGDRLRGSGVKCSGCSTENLSACIYFDEKTYCPACALGVMHSLQAQVRQLSEEKYILLHKLCWQRCGTKSKSCPECDECTKRLLTKNW